MLKPSLFYQFIGKGEGSAAWDCYTFCEVLGGEEANRQLHNHWKTWVTEDHFIKMAAAGVNSLRVPVGDFQFIREFCLCNSISLLVIIIIFSISSY